MSNAKFNYEKNGKIILKHFLITYINNSRFTDSTEKFMWLLKFATVKKIKDFLTKM